jgi:hypothetical protein
LPLIEGNRWPADWLDGESLTTFGGVSGGISGVTVIVWVSNFSWLVRCDRDEFANRFLVPIRRNAGGDPPCSLQHLLLPLSELDDRGYQPPIG